MDPQLATSTPLESATCFSRTRSIPKPIENGYSNPSLKELLKELESVVDKWQQLMLELGVELRVIRTAVKNHMDDVYWQKFDVFDHWLKNDPDVSWSRVIEALRVIDEENLASQLEKKYAWKDPRVNSTIRYLSVSQTATIIPVKADISNFPGLPAIPQKLKNLEYFTLEARLPHFLQLSDSLFKSYARDIALYPLWRNLTDMAKIIKTIEESPDKDNFMVGIEARFGTAFYRLHPSYENKHLQKQDCVKPEFRSTCFNTSVKNEDAQRLVRCQKRKRLGNDYTQLTLKFEVEGYEAYSATVVVMESGKRFHLTGVYKEDTPDQLGRYDITIPGRKYDVRVANCSGYLISDCETSISYKIARKIVASMRSLGDGLMMIMKGSYGKYDWCVKYCRQRLQKQYDWRPDKKWILAVYEVSVYQSETNLVNKTTAPSDQLVRINFDYKRIEVELWGRRVYPKHVNDTYPTRDDYYHMEGVAGVRFLNGDTRPPYNWTTEELMIDFLEFLKEALLTAHLLDGSVTLPSH